jgi:hypothetical protein
MPALAVEPGAVSVQCYPDLSAEREWALKKSCATFMLKSCSRPGLMMLGVEASNHIATVFTLYQDFGQPVRFTQKHATVAYPTQRPIRRGR